MTLEEWVAETRKVIEEAGFVVEIREGFPLVKPPDTLAGRVRLLELKLPYPSERRIYREGMLVMPSVPPEARP